MWVGVELSLGVPGSLDGNCAGFGRLEEGMMEGRRLEEVGSPDVLSFFRQRSPSAGEFNG